MFQVGDLSIHDSLAVFTSILISRHCFSLADLVLNVALHSLVAACLPSKYPRLALYLPELVSIRSPFYFPDNRNEILQVFFPDFPR